MTEDVVSVNANEPLNDPWEMPSFTNHIVLADGTTYEGHAIGFEESDELAITLDRLYKVADIAAVFGDPEKTKEITSHTTPITTEKFYNFIRLTAISQLGRKMSLRMRLGK